MNKITIEVIEERPKAIKGRDAEGNEAWLQRRWVTGNLVSDTTWEKAVANANEYKADRKATSQSYKEFSNGFHQVSVERETAKAIACKAETSIYGKFDQDKLVWFPKSVCKDDTKVPGWLLLKKAQELGEDLIGGSNHYSVDIETIGGIDLHYHAEPAQWSANRKH